MVQGNRNEMGVLSHHSLSKRGGSPPCCLSLLLPRSVSGLLKSISKAVNSRNTATGSICRDQAFRVLKLLLKNYGKTVSREELHQKVWPDGTFVDFQDALSHDVNRIREALSDTAEQPPTSRRFPARAIDSSIPSKPLNLRQSQ